MALFGKRPEGKKSKEAKPATREGFKEISVSFACQTCGERAKGAEYNPSTEIVIYTCPSGHKNMIENFGLDIV